MADEFIPEDKFWEEYQPVPNPFSSEPDNVQWEIEDVKLIDLHHMWTVVDAEGDWQALPGWHIVNRLFYLVTKKPWVTGEEVGEYAADDTPKCDLCGAPEDDEPGGFNDWNGDTGNHRSCEEAQARG